MGDSIHPCLNHYKAIVNKIVDVNTIVVDIDLGMGVWL